MILEKSVENPNQIVENNRVARVITYRLSGLMIKEIKI